MAKQKFLQWFSEMLTKLNKPIKFLGFCSLFIILLLIITGCSNRDYQRPTKAFYVNDFAESFSPALKRNIVQKGEALYDLSKDDKDNGGAQIVFASFTVKDETEIASWNYNKTELFREWKIGKNDMGLLVIFFFLEEEKEDIIYKEFVEPVAFEVGYRMSQYLTAIRLGNILDSINFEDDFEMGVTHLLHELLSVICLKAYDFDEFDSWEVASPGYQEYFETYVEEDVIGDVSMNLLYYLFSSHSSLTDKLLAFIPSILILVSSGGLIINKGMGGSSGGAGLFRRRR